MSFLDLAKQRNSEHFFLEGQTISDEEFLQILEPVTHTPSGYNAQPWHFLLIREPERLIDIQKLAYNQEHITQAGNLVIVLGDRDFGPHECERILSEWKAHRGMTDKQAEALKGSLLKDRQEWKKREMMLRNVTLATMSFLLSAEDLGWATCPMMGFRQLDLQRVLELPEGILPVMMIALGKRDEKQTIDKMPRKRAEDICSFENYS